MVNYFNYQDAFLSGNKDLAKEIFIRDRSEFYFFCSRHNLCPATHPVLNESNIADILSRLPGCYIDDFIIHSRPNLKRKRSE